MKSNRWNIHRLRESTEAPPRVVAELNAKALQSNYQAISELAPGQSLLPMIKANAYGHGAEWAVGLLAGLSSLYGFGVATLEEGAEARSALGPRHRRTSVIVFSGAIPWSEEKGHYCERHGLTPVIGSEEDWRRFVREGWPERLPYELKFNTGMNRLGLPPSFAGQIVKSLRAKPSEWHPRGVMSHLAMGEDPESRLSRLQREQFVRLKRELAGAFPAAHFHLANSAAIWNRKLWNLDELTDVVRPGISLYGVPPWKDAPARKLQSVMTLKASVIALHRLARGESVGYGGTFQVKSEEPVFAAILSAGYADGVHRALSNQGHVWIDGHPGRFIGIVSMDLSAVTCLAGTKIGSWAEILGPHVDIWAQARAAGTIPYELFTSVTSRVRRSYG